MSTQVQINDVIPKTQITATGGQTVFTTNWTANAASDVVVYARTSAQEPDDLTQLVNSINYTVAFIGGSQIVEVTFLVGRAAGDVITITRDTPADRLNLYTNTNFTPSMLNQDVGILTLVDQQAQLYNEQVAPHYNVSATPDLGDSFTGTGGDIYLPVLGASQVWKKNDANTEIEAFNVPSGGGLAPRDATYILQTPWLPGTELPNSQPLSPLATGFMSSVTGTGVVSTRTLQGTANQIDVTNGAGTSNPVFSLSNALVLPGTMTFGGNVDADGYNISNIGQANIGNIQISGNTIISTDTNGNINLTPDGAGDLVLDGLNWPQTDGTLNQALTTDGAGQLGWSTVSTVTTPTTDNAIARFDGTGGALQNSAVTIADNAVAAFNINGVLPQVNYLEIQSAPTGQSVNLVTQGSDASVNMWLIPKGGAQVAISSTTPSPIVFTDSIHTAVFQFATNAGNQFIVFPDGGVGNGTVALTLGSPPTITNNAIPRYTGTDGFIQNSVVTIDNTGIMAGGTWQGNTVAVGYGGTGNTSVGANGTLAQSDGTKYTFTTATYPSTATATGTILRADGSNWVATTATYPATTTINNILYSSANNTVGEIATQKDAVLVSNHSNTPVWSSSMTDGQIIIGKTNDIPIAANLTAGTGISIVNAANSITLNATGGTVNSGTANQLAYYATTGTAVSGLTSANSATLVTSNTGVPAWTGSMTNGQLLIGSTGATPVLATLTAGAGISIANAAGSITISGTGSGIGWTEVTGTTQVMAADNGYVASNAGLVTLTLPATAAFGTIINIVGKGAGGWKIAQNAGQNIQLGSTSSTVGATGYIESTNRYDSIELLCTTANTTWTVLGGPQGNITVA